MSRDESPSQTITVSENHNEFLTMLFKPEEYASTTATKPLHLRKLPPSFFMQPTEECRRASVNPDHNIKQPLPNNIGGGGGGIGICGLSSNVGSGPVITSTMGMNGIGMAGTILHTKSNSSPASFNPESIDIVKNRTPSGGGGSGCGTGGGSMHHHPIYNTEPVTCPTTLALHNSIYTDAFGHPAVHSRKKMAANIFEICPLDRKYGMALDSCGQVFFLNHETQDTTWFDPRLPQECQSWGMTLQDLENAHRAYAKALESRNPMEVMSNSAIFLRNEDPQQSHCRSFSQPVSSSYSGAMRSHATTPSLSPVGMSGLMHVSSTLTPSSPTKSKSMQQTPNSPHNTSGNPSGTPSTPNTPSGMLQVNFNPSGMLFLDARQIRPGAGGGGGGGGGVGNNQFTLRQGTFVTSPPPIPSAAPTITTGPHGHKCHMITNNNPVNHCHPQFSMHNRMGPPILTGSTGGGGGPASSLTGGGIHSHQSSLDSGLGPSLSTTGSLLAGGQNLEYHTGCGGGPALFSNNNNNNNNPSTNSSHFHPFASINSVDLLHDLPNSNGPLMDSIMADDAIHFEDLPDLTELGLDLPMSSPNGAMHVQ